MHIYVITRDAPRHGDKTVPDQGLSRVDSFHDAVKELNKHKEIQPYPDFFNQESFDQAFGPIKDEHEPVPKLKKRKSL